MLSLGLRMNETACEPSKGEISVSYNTCHPWTSAPWFFQVRHSGGWSFQGRSQGPGYLTSGTKPLALPGEATIWGDVSLLCVTMPEMGLFARPMSLPLLPSGCNLSILCVESSTSSFHIFFKGIRSICSCRLNVATGRGEFRIFLCCHLGPSSCLYWDRGQDWVSGCG